MYDKYYGYKNVLENLFGNQAWRELKETGSVMTWRKWVVRSFKALEISIEATVKHHDPQWMIELRRVFEHGESQIKLCKEIDEVIAVAASVFTEASFMQVGFMPQRVSQAKPTTLRKENWKLDAHRSVIYLQSEEQKNEAARYELGKKRGSWASRVIFAHYKRSKAELAFTEWLETEDLDSLVARFS